MSIIPKLGRPRKIETAKQLSTAIDEYFASCYEFVSTEEFTGYKNIKPITYRGLAIYMGVHIDTLWDWTRTRPELCEPLKQAKLIIEEYTERQLFDSKKPTAGIKFSLINNFKWADKTEVETKNINTNTTLDINFVGDEKEEQE